MVNVCLQLIPPMNESISDDILAAQLDLEHTKSTERERLFLIYAKQWWKEFLEIREEHRTRLVKIFGQVTTPLELLRYSTSDSRTRMASTIPCSPSFSHFAQVDCSIRREKRRVSLV